MSSTQLRKWINLIESKNASLNEFAPGDGNNARNYYEATVAFIEYYRDQRQDLDPDQLDDEVAWLTGVANGFLRSFEDGLKEFFGIDTMLQDELTEWYLDEYNLDIRPYVKQHYSQAQSDGKVFDKETFISAFNKEIEKSARNIITEFSNDRRLNAWWIDNFTSLMSKNAGTLATKIEELLQANPEAFSNNDDFETEIGHELIGEIYFSSKLSEIFSEKDFTVADDVALSVGPAGSESLWAAYLAAAGIDDTDDEYNAAPRTAVAPAPMKPAPAVPNVDDNAVRDTFLKVLSNDMLRYSDHKVEVWLRTKNLSDPDAVGQAVHSVITKIFKDNVGYYLPIMIDIYKKHDRDGTEVFYKDKNIINAVLKPFKESPLVLSLKQQFPTDEWPRIEKGMYQAVIDILTGGYLHPFINRNVS